MPLQRSKGVGKLAVKNIAGHSKIRTLYQEGCSKIRVPRQLDPRSMEAVLINTSGGLTDGDILEWTIEAESGTNLTVSTQACEKIYKSRGTDARVNTQIKVGDQATLYWCPQETILFDQARLNRQIEVELHENATFLACESIILGRTARGEEFAHGHFQDDWGISVNGDLLHAEKLKLDAATLNKAAILGAHRAFATLLFIAPHAESLLLSIRQIIDDRPGCIGGASFWQGKLITRLTAPDGYELRKSLIPTLKKLLGTNPFPKVWSL